MSYFPMMIDRENKAVLVIGGGEEGDKKTEILSRFGARITLIARNALPEAVKRCVRYEQRDFDDPDIDGEAYSLIVAATDDRELNERISRLAGQRRIPVNVVDDTQLCTFIFPAIIKEGEVVCAVSSGGRSPYLAQHVKRLIRQVLPPGIGGINERMGQYRDRAKEEIPDPAARRAFLRNKLEDILGSGSVAD